jgi:glycine reductase
MNKIKVVHYINQFFSGIGGEEKADIAPEFRNEIVGPGTALQKQFGDEAEIVGTVICGDSYFNENLDEATKEILEMIKNEKPDMFIAGPAFNAGRYGAACGAIAKAVKDELGIPVVTAMYIENPGADMFKKDLHIISTSNSAAGMRKAIKPLAKLALKLAKNETIGAPSEEGYLERGIRKNYFAEKIGAERAVDMLVNKLKGEEFVTEYPMPIFDSVEPGKAITNLSSAKIALVTSGGMVPSGNPDRIEASSASKYGKYELDNLGETAHGGFDPTYANNNPNVVLPVDALRELEKEGVIGSIHPYYYSTTGNGTSVKNSKAYAAEFSKELVAAGVDGVILTST